MRIVPNFELFYNLFAQRTLLQILLCVLTVFRIQFILRILDHLLHQPVKIGNMRIDALCAGLFQRGAQRDAGIFRHLIDRFQKRDLFIIGYEGEHIAAGTADKAFIDLLVL